MDIDTLKSLTRQLAAQYDMLEAHVHLAVAKRLAKKETESLNAELNAQDCLAQIIKLIVEMKSVKEFEVTLARLGFVQRVSK